MLKKTNDDEEDDKQLSEGSKSKKFNCGQENKTEQKRVFALIGSSALGVLICVLDIITVVYMITESKDLRRESQLCISCSNLRLYPDDDKSVFDVEEPDSCCVRDGGNLSIIVDKLVTRNLKEKLIAESRPFEPLHCNLEVPAIKMVGKLTNEQDPSQSRFPWMKWDLALRRGGRKSRSLSHDDTFITVGSTGIYLLYSQLVLRNTPDKYPTPYSTGMNRYYLHAIYRKSGSSHDEILLGGSYTYYTTVDGNSMITSYVGSPYQLRKGDQLGVKVHDISHVVPSNMTNFFGVHLIQ